MIVHYSTNEISVHYSLPLICGTSSTSQLTSLCSLQTRTCATLPLDSIFRSRMHTHSSTIRNPPMDRTPPHDILPLACTTPNRVKTRSIHAQQIRQLAQAAGHLVLAHQLEKLRLFGLARKLDLGPADDLFAIHLCFPPLLLDARRAAPP